VADEQDDLLTFMLMSSPLTTSSTPASRDASDVQFTQTHYQYQPPSVVVIGAGADKQADKWQNLKNLKNLFQAGFISKEEYNERRAQLIDDMTGTRSTHSGTVGHSTITRTRIGRNKAVNYPPVVPRPPPDFTKIESEHALKYTYDLATAQWKTRQVTLKLDPVPFSRGALRLVYHMQDLSSSPEEDDPNFKKGQAGSLSLTYVAKISMDPRDNQGREVYFADVQMQCLAKMYAAKYNEYGPPKKVDFVSACIYQLLDREGRPICGVERFISGVYRKHNNNYGYVSEEERNTPQSFSHFTYEASGHYVLICDIQGVGDMYTDPQVHSADGQGFGKGNLGQAGIDKFLKSHHCNAICRYLKLPSINANYESIGTLPVTPYMAYPQVAVVNIGVGVGVGMQTPLLPPLQPRTDTDKVQTQCPWCERCAIL